MIRSGVFAATLTLLAGAVAAQGTDFRTASRIVCTPERVTECKAAGDCKVTPANARDKLEVLTVDFRSKDVLLRDQGKDKKFAVVDSDTVEGDVRRVTIRQGGADGQKRNFTLDRSGTLTFTEQDGRLKSEALCKAGPGTG